MTATAPAPTFARIAELVATYVQSEHPVSGCERCAKLASSALAMARVRGSVSATMVEDRRVAGEIVVDHAATVRKPNRSGTSTDYAEGVAELETALELVVGIVSPGLPGIHPKTWAETGDGPAHVLRRAAELNTAADERDRSLIALAATAHRDAYLWTGDEVVDTATALLRAASFREDAGAFEPTGHVAALARIAELDGDDHPASTAPPVRSFVAAVANSTVNGYSLPTNPERVLDELDTYALAELVEYGIEKIETSDGGTAYVIGAVELPAGEEHDDHGTAWSTHYSWTAQRAKLIYRPSRSIGTDATVGIRFEATEVSRETGAQLCGVDVVRRTEERGVTVTRHRTARDYEAAKAIATRRQIFGSSKLVLAVGVELVFRPYATAGISPESLSASIRLEGVELPRRS